MGGASCGLVVCGFTRSIGGHFVDLGQTIHGKS